MAGCVLAITLAACGSDSKKAVDGGPLDVASQIDAKPDAQPIDAAIDAAIDAPPDAVILPDAPTDAPKTDASMTDASMTDAAMDGSMPDAPMDGGSSTDIQTACAHACDAIFVCFMIPPDPSCNQGCEMDLADCTPQQVQQVDNCSQTDCSSDPNKLSDCLTAISCVGN